MPELTPDQQQQLRAAVDSGQSENVAQTVSDLGIQTGPPSPWARDAVWIIFIGGMLVVLAALTLGLVLKSDPASAITTLATAIVTGLFALFAPSPVAGSGR